MATAFRRRFALWKNSHQLQVTAFFVSLVSWSFILRDGALDNQKRSDQLRSGIFATVHFARRCRPPQACGCSAFSGTVWRDASCQQLAVCLTPRFLWVLICLTFIIFSFLVNVSISCVSIALFSPSSRTYTYPYVPTRRRWWFDIFDTTVVRTSLAMQGKPPCHLVCDYFPPSASESVAFFPFLQLFILINDMSSSLLRFFSLCLPHICSFHTCNLVGAMWLWICQFQLHNNKTKSQATFSNFWPHLPITISNYSW